MEISEGCWFFSDRKRGVGVGGVCVCVCERERERQGGTKRRGAGGGRKEVRREGNEKVGKGEE